MEHGFTWFILKQYIFDEFIKVHVRLVELDKLAYLVYWNMFVKSFLYIGIYIYIYSVFLIKEIIIRGWVKIKIKIAEGQRSKVKGQLGRRFSCFAGRMKSELVFGEIQNNVFFEEKKKIFIWFQH